MQKGADRRADKSAGSAAQPTPAPLAPRVPWFGPVDALIAAGCLAVTLGVCLPWAVRYRQEASALDRERATLAGRCSGLQNALRYLEARRASETQLRRVVSSYVTDVEARNTVTWPVVVGELSLRRPAGVWASTLSGDGPQFRAEVSALSPDLVSGYAQGLRTSPYVEFAGLPAGQMPDATKWTVIGRTRGDAR